MTVSSHIGIITFPGSNGDRDAYDAFALNLGLPTRMIDHREIDLSGLAAIVLPGGFSYGDHLRCGAIARFAPVMEPLKSFAERKDPALWADQIIEKSNGEFRAIGSANIIAFNLPPIIGLGTGSGFEYQLQDLRGGPDRDRDEVAGAHQRVLTEQLENKG